MTTAPLKFCVVIATVGRPQEVAFVLEELRRQTRRPDRIIISATSEADLPAHLESAEAVFGPKGLCAQRNTALRDAVASSDIIAFFDDDYVPSKFAIERALLFFLENPDIVGATGDLIDDGIKGPGIEHEDALKMVARADAGPQQRLLLPKDVDGLYGCNMIYRVAAIRDAKFDEALPLYGWQEDIDFSAQVGRRGRLVKTNAWTGVHRGVKKSRTSGVKAGYSQIANPLYLVGKGTMTSKKAATLTIKNVIANHARVLFPEPWMDRAGRLKGNWLALIDLLLGKLHPTRILEL